jgi:TRAP-type mannitol/chloroaromatic compound transport system substrate-binding protein
MVTIQKIICLFFIIFLVGCSGSDPDQLPASSGVNNNVTYKWKMVTTWPANFPIFQEGAEKFANDVRSMSNGRLDIKVFAGGELVPALQAFDAVSQGSIEMAHGSPYYWAGKVPEAQFFSTVPFGMTVRGMQAWLYHGGGLELWREIYKPYNIYPMPMGNTGIQMGGWFNKKINSASDLKGLRMRIPGIGGKVLKKAGGNPVLMSGGEIYTALERGIIDATEWVGPFHDLRLGLNRAAKYYYYPGWHEPGTEFELMVNMAYWEKLPDDLKKIVETAAAANSDWIYTSMEYHNSQALLELKEKRNIEVLEFPKDVMAELKSLTEITLQEEAEKNPKFEKIYAAYRDFQSSYAEWGEMTEAAYRRARSNE